MFKPLTVSIDNLRDAAPRAAAAAAADNATNVFRVLHGFYGNLFLSKFASGQVHESGQEKGADMGVTSAKSIWAHGLRKFDAGVVRAALNQCLTEHLKFPPSFPEFLALCSANQPRETYRHTTPALPMDGKLRSEHAAKARAINAKHAQKAANRATGYVEAVEGLDGLKQAIANAVASAGGDEVCELVRLDRLLSPKKGEF